ncbi:MAG: DsbA family protein [Marinicaulis sp.]|nr:DsbA family protein [Marinicaulis sp.]
MFLSSFEFPFARAALAGAALALAACSGDGSAGASDKVEAEEINTEVTGALGEMAQGSPDAPLTVIEYASVTCPHCATFHEDVYPALKEKYIDTGKVQFVFREFPTAPAELSVVGSMLARCAADKGGPDAYFAILGALFKGQRTWIFADSPRDELLKIVAQAGMDEAAFETCVRRQELVDLINNYVNEGRDKYNVGSTPSFIVDGQLRHFSTVEDFSAALDEALEKAEE